MPQQGVNSQIYRLDDKATNSLLRLPETGIGYQILKATIREHWSTGSGIFFAFNADLLISIDDLSKLLKFGYNRLCEAAKSEERVGFEGGKESIELNPNVPKDLPYESHSDPDLEPFSLPPHDKSAKDFEGFYRISAYPNDRRVTEDFRLRSGTYTTTASDIRYVSTGLGAVGRYALPNPDPASYVYPVVPNSPGIYSDSTSVDVRVGAVHPAFGQSGGGVEAFFPDGTPERSVLQPYKLSEQ